MRLKIGIKKGNEIPVDKLNGKPEGSKYPDSNCIREFIAIAQPVELKKAAGAESFVNDDVPFLIDLWGKDLHAVASSEVKPGRISCMGRHHEPRW